MFESCPVCEKESSIRKVSKKEEILVRGEPIKTTVTSHKCSECGEEFLDTSDSNDPLKSAYREYREVHDMLQPEDIKEIRKSIGLTQGELSDLLGWGRTTLSRYENGSLQEKAHDFQLKKLEDPIFVVGLIKARPSFVPTSKRDTIIRQLNSDIKTEWNVDYYIEEYLTPDEIDEKNGCIPFMIDKINNVILYFCMYGLWKTSINKYLFYADFKHFKEYVNGITGSRYKRLPYGPAPENYEIILGRLVDEGAIQVEEISFASSTCGEKYTTAETPDLTVFSETEYEVIEKVKNHFKNFTAKDISDFSHGEKGYQQTAAGQYISYSFAKDLRL